MSKILSAFLDEAGQERKWEPGAKWYLLTLVLHDQDDDVSAPVDAYERYIRSKGLPDIPFHMVELMHGRRSYEGIELADLRFMDGDVSATYERVYGSRRMFRANHLKQARRKLLE